MKLAHTNIYTDGNLIEESWMLNNEYHNEAGPSRVFYNSEGSVKEVEYYLNDVKLLKSEWEEKLNKTTDATLTSDNKKLSLRERLALKQQKVEGIAVIVSNNSEQTASPSRSIADEPSIVVNPQTNKSGQETEKKRKPRSTPLDKITDDHWVMIEQNGTFLNSNSKIVQVLALQIKRPPSNMGLIMHPRF